jgi:hypothetical protein
MKSPFPGMDPYIEACGLWGDFQHSLIDAISRRLAETTSERCLVRCGLRAHVVLLGWEADST